MEYVAIGAALIGGGLQAKSQRDAGKFAQIQHEEAAEDEMTAAKDREIERKRRLVEVLAVQNARAGAEGAAIGFGSRAAIALDDARRASYDTISDRASSGRRALMLRSAGRQANRQGQLRGAATLLDTAAGAVDAWPGG